MKLKLPIFHHSDETRSLDKLDIDYNIESCETQEIIFYKIDAIAPAEDGRYSSIFTGGEEFICALSMKEVEDLIDRNIGLVHLVDMNRIPKGMSLEEYMRDFTLEIGTKPHTWVDKSIKDDVKVSYSYIVELFTSKSDTTHKKEIVFDGEPRVIDGHIFEFRSTRQLTNGEAYSRVEGTRGIKEIREDIKK